MTKKKRIVLIIISWILLLIGIWFLRIYSCELENKRCLDSIGLSDFACMYKCPYMFWYSLFPKSLTVLYSDE